MKNYFTEEEFTNTFLSLLALEGITSFNKNELLKKLRYYYDLEEYQNLFYSIGLLFGYDKVDLDSSLNKAINNDLIITKNNELQLMYSSVYQDYQTKTLECQKAIRKLAKEFALRLKIEQKSQYPMNIYYSSPNTEYNIFKGKYQNQNLYYQLITDGIIQNTEEKTHQGYMVDNPMLPNSKIYLEDIKMARIKLINAKYAIIKGFSDNKIGQSKVYTLLNKQEDLEKIKEYVNSEEVLSDAEKPMIRRISL